MINFGNKGEERKEEWGKKREEEKRWGETWKGKTREGGGRKRFGKGRSSIHQGSIWSSLQQSLEITLRTTKALYQGAVKRY